MMTELPSLEPLLDTAFSTDPAALLTTLEAYAATRSEEPIFKELLAVAKLRSGDTAPGVSLMREAADTAGHGPDTRSLSLLMRTLYNEQEFDAAFALAERILQGDPRCGPALRIAARVCARKGEDDRAEAFWRGVCEVSPDKLEAALNVARIAQRRARWDTQAEFADIALVCDPDNADALRQAVQARVRTRRLEDFPSLIPRLYRLEPEKVLGYLRGAVGPAHAPAVAATLVALRQSGQTDIALATLSAELIKVWTVAGRRAMAEKNVAAAAALFRAVQLADPTERGATEALVTMSRPDLIAMRGALKVGDAPGAKSHAEQVLNIHPTQYEAWCTLARLHQDSDPTKAIGYFETCIALEPDDIWPRMSLGKAYERAGRLLEAVDIYDGLAVLEGPEVRHYRDDANRAAVLLRRTILRQARDAFKEHRFFDAWSLCERLRPDEMRNVDVAGLLSSIKRALIGQLRRKHAQREADFIDEAQAYLARDPNEREVLAPLGRALVSAKSFARALPVLRTLASIDTSDAQLHLQIARCALALRRRDEALAAIGAALRLDPSLPAALSLQRQLEAY